MSRFCYLYLFSSQYALLKKSTVVRPIRLLIKRTPFMISSELLFFFHSHKLRADLNNKIQTKREQKSQGRWITGAGFLRNNTLIQVGMATMSITTSACLKGKLQTRPTVIVWCIIEIDMIDLDYALMVGKTQLLFFSKKRN